MKQINIVNSVDVTATLLNIPLNDTVYCPNNVINSQVMRTVAARLKKQNRGLFLIKAEKEGINITRK